MPPRLLSFLPAGLVPDKVDTASVPVVIHTHSGAASANCPLCGEPSMRLHSRYRRRLADFPWQGRPVVVEVRARRFRCATPDCARRVFSERLPAIAGVKARRTVRLGDIQRHLGLALGGEPGSRLAVRLAMPVSGDTLLRLIRSGKPPTIHLPASSASTTGRSAAVKATVPSSAISNAGASSISCRIGRRKPSPSGSSSILGSKSSFATESAPMQKALGPGRPAPSRLPIAGTFSAISATRRRDWSTAIVVRSMPLLEASPIGVMPCVPLRARPT